MQHTLNTAYTTYCIIPTSTVSRSQPVSHLSADHVGLNSLHSHNYELTNEYSLNSHRASLPHYSLQITLLEVLLQTHSITASQCISAVGRSRPPCASLSSLNLNRQLHLQTRSITASKCISKLTQSRPPSASLSSLNVSLQLHLQPCSITASKCLCNITRSQPPSASPNSLDHSPRVHL